MRNANITRGLKRDQHGDWVAVNRYGDRMTIARCNYAGSGEWYVQSVEAAGRMSEDQCSQFPTLRAAVEYVEQVVC